MDMWRAAAPSIDMIVPDIYMPEFKWVCEQYDRLGNGQGMVVQRGFPQPPSLHIDRLREARPGYLFDVITHGFGRQPDLAHQIPVPDRWAIVAYVKVLQYSQHAPLEAVPPAERRKLEAASAGRPQASGAGAAGGTLR